MTLRTFAEKHRLKISRDECGDEVIVGRRGQLYVDGGCLCLMVLDGAVAESPRWRALGGRLWLGDVSPHPKTGQRVQDVKIVGIPAENARLAIKMIRVRPPHVMSAARLAALASARRALPPPRRGRHTAPESLAEGLPVVSGGDDPPKGF